MALKWRLFITALIMALNMALNMEIIYHGS
jgi:hypothetical protein